MPTARTSIIACTRHRFGVVIRRMYHRVALGVGGSHPGGVMRRLQCAREEGIYGLGGSTPSKRMHDVPSVSVFPKFVGGGIDASRSLWAPKSNSCVFSTYLCTRAELISKPTVVIEFKSGDHCFHSLTARGDRGDALVSRKTRAERKLGRSQWLSQKIEANQPSVLSVLPRFERTRCRPCVRSRFRRDGPKRSVGHPSRSTACCENRVERHHLAGGKLGLE